MIPYILVDDDERNLVYVKQKIDLLEKEYGLHHVASYSSSKLALESIKEDKFELLIVDYEMPIYNGVELAQRIAKTKKVIFLTSTTNNEKNIINNVNIVGYLTKPFDNAEFKEIVKNKIIEVRKSDSGIKKKDHQFIDVGANKTLNIHTEKVYYITTAQVNGKKPKKNHVDFYGQNDRLIFSDVRSSINHLAEELKPMGFIKISKGTILNKVYIKERDNTNISLYDCKETFVLTKTEKMGFLGFVRDLFH